MAEAYKCARCASEPATQYWNEGNDLTAFVVQEHDLLGHGFDLRIPLCDDCYPVVERFHDDFRTAQTPEDKDFYGDELLRLARELNSSIIRSATPGLSND